MAIKRVLFNIYQLVVFFFVFFGFYDTAGMSPEALSVAVNGENSLHVVTLTRITRDEKGSIIPDKCLPISAAEAVTIFAVASAFCGADQKSDEIREKIDTACKFDNEQFELIDERFGKLNRQAFASELLRQELGSVDGLERSLIDKIVLNKDTVIFKAFLSKQEDNSELEVNVDKINFDDTKKSVRNGISGDKFIPELAGESKIKGTITFVVEVNGERHKVTTWSVFSKLRTAIDSSKKIKDEELKGKYFSNNDSFLSGYLAIKKRDPNYYHELYRQVMKALGGYCFQERSLCLFVANELFFGKGFVLPSRYPSLLPFLPDYVLSCVNFLLEENNVVNGTETIEDAINQGIVTSDIKKWPLSTTAAIREGGGKKFFRSASFYSIGEKNVQQYTKSSYFRECASALKNGYVYLFGQKRDIQCEGDDFTKLISTQICFDLQTKRRSNQNDVEAPIHVFQSNTHDLGEALLRESHSCEPSRADIPGHPRIIIHADPKNQELFIKHEEKRFFWGQEEAPKSILSDSKTHYTTMSPQESFTFSLNKGDHVDSYTITHWVLK